MGETSETAWDVTGQLRQLAVELVRDGRTAEAMSVFASIGAVEMMPTFSGVAGVAGTAVQPAHTPDY
jgi:hypothetical protein